MKGKTSTATPAADDPRSQVASARLEEIELEAARATAARAEADRQRVELDAARVVAEAELLDAKMWREAEQLGTDFPAAAEALAKLGNELRAAFDTIVAVMPRLLAAQATVDGLVKRAATLAPRANLHKLRPPRRLGGLHPDVLAVINHAIQAQTGVTL